MHKTLSSRLIGYAASLLLTLVAFLIFVSPDFFHLALQENLIVLFILAISQFVVQSLCFLNVWGERGPRWNLFVYLSTLSIVLIIVIFTIWVMNHLNYNMM